ncbi:acid-sensing ion channel 2-like isoform X1 [Penaeus chinensis]|uniref:acid-sensing ion channel 2-like isoform X1 n=1 Tax=Penaeus chinensis TaxID=139456 RepID=UPI001FB76E18|nr:acid-sensing ion channel 2-like isoform X1 [Penaeus chinensis]
MGGKLFGVYMRLSYRGHPYGYSFGGYTVAVHNPLVPVTQAIENGFNCMQKLTKNKKKLGCHRLILVAFQKIKLINRQDHECSPHPLYNTEACRSTCLHKHVVHRHGCKLPYMNVEGPECRTPEKVKAVEESMRYLFFNGHFNYTPCGCVPECFSSIYRQNTDTTWNTNRNAIMKVYFAGTEYEEVVESYSFSSSNLVSRIGGFMGLLLGASVLSLLQAGELVLHKARRILYWVLCAVLRCEAE